MGGSGEPMCTHGMWRQKHAQFYENSMCSTYLCIHMGSMGHLDMATTKKYMHMLCIGAAIAFFYPTHTFSDYGIAPPANTKLAQEYS